ncbi:LysM peptidoglycan-binding domain-containing protein [Pseudomonas aeruginosa]
MTESKICTCPSGNGSLRHPCPAHPASVEQAGGDERAAFEAAASKLGIYTCNFERYTEETAAHENRINARVEDPVRVGDYRSATLQDCWKVWQEARAALAQPSPVRSSLLINGYQLRAALEFIAPDGTAKQLESEARIEWRQQDADFLEAGLYAWCAEYPEEGCVLLDEEPTTSQPSPAQAEQAEVERPEVVAWQYRVTAGPQTGWSLWHPGKGEEFERSYTVERRPLMTVAQHERIVGALRAERDAALARVAELDKQCRDDVARALGLRPNEERGFAWSYLLASIKACVKASENTAQAQHSVPAYVNYTTRPAESLAGIALRQLKDESRWVEIRDINAHAFPNMQSHSYYPAGTVIKLPAAAPGKSVPQAWLDVQAERRRQVEAEGWTPEHDDAHSHGQMARAAACYALAGSSAPSDGTAALLVSLAWPWDEQWWKPTSARRDLVKACALGLAEIERLDRAGISQNPQPGATTASS